MIQGVPETSTKEPDAFGQSGDEIVVRLLIPMGHYKAGAKKFQAWVNM